MGEISQSVKVNGVRVRALYDSGASDNFLSKRVADRIKLYFRGKKSFILADGRRIVGRLANISVEIKGRSASTKVLVSNILPQDGYDIILGQRFLQENDVDLDFSADKIKFGKGQPKNRRIARLR